MGDQNYFMNKYNPYMGQNYGYNYRHQQQQQQPPQQQFSNLFDLRSPEEGRFTVNTNMPIYNTGTNLLHNVGPPNPQSRETTSFQDDKPPPSYEESKNDMLLSRSDENKKGSPAWNYVSDRKEPSQKTSISSFFDIPGQTEPVQKSSEWSSDNFNSQNVSHQHYLQPSHLNPYNQFSQQSSSTYSSHYGGQSDHQFAQNSERQSNDYTYSNKRGFLAGRQQNRGRGKGGSRGRGNWQNRSKDGRSWQGQFGGNNKNHSGENSNQNWQSFSDDFHGRNMEEGKLTDEQQERGSDDVNVGAGYQCEESYEVLEKKSVFVPYLSVIMKYEHYPPDPEEMGKMFKDLVIYFFFKIPKNKREQNPFVVICESFRRSAGYGPVEVEDGYDINAKDRKFCTLRYKSMMMARGVGENNNLKEPRVLAGVELINKLAMSCYTLEAKTEYFSVQAFREQLDFGDVPGLYCIVSKADAYDFETARTYIKNILSKDDDSDVEYMFELCTIQDAIKLKSWANQFQPIPLDARVIKEEVIGICKHRTPQYWRDKILASGSMETGRFILKPPQGIGNLLMKDFNIKNAIGKLRAVPCPRVCTLQNVYGPPGVGPNISKALNPWDRGGSRKNKKSKNKEKNIIKMVKRGVPLTETKGFKYLSKHKKKKLRQKFGP